MMDSYLTCKDELRRETVRTAPLYGLDFIEVGSDQKTLEVFFLGKAPDNIKPANVVIAGGRRTVGIRATNVRVVRQKDPTFDDYMEVIVNQPGDFSTYTLSLVAVDDKGIPTTGVMAGFDPRYASVEFNFKAGCPSDLDCKIEPICPPVQRTKPEINYLAKDYGSFRQLILDRLAVTIPDWQETHLPDIGIALVEVLAYVGDYLSYYQDAVATEAYLGTARQRISVRRHARLVNYFLHEGCNSRAWLTVGTDADTSLDLAQTYFTTAIPGKSPDTHVLQPADFIDLNTSGYEVFEPLGLTSTRLPIYAAHSEIHFYTWGDCECCLAKGATSATLTDTWKAPANPTQSPKATTGSNTGEPPGAVRLLQLKPGDVLIFEEVFGPKTGNPADADPSHRQAVRLTSVKTAVDPLYHPYSADYGQPVVEIEWCAEDALTFPLCLSSQMPAPDCSCKENISVARGNVILVDNGATTTEPLGVVPTASNSTPCPSCCQPPQITVTAGKFRPTLSHTPLTFSEALPPCGCASPLLTQDPRQALPDISLVSTTITGLGSVVTNWTPKRDLLESGSRDASFVVEIDDAGVAHLRFGDGELGRQPDAGSTFEAHYRLGNGTAGNVGAETISTIAFRQVTASGAKLTVRNPLPATGGIDPEPVSQAKLLAPYAFSTTMERAITADDYSALASDNTRRMEARASLIKNLERKAARRKGKPVKQQRDVCSSPFQSLQAAQAKLRWGGSWYEVLLAVDPTGVESSSPELLAEITSYLEPYRRIGHDLAVRAAEYVPIDLALNICVRPDYQQAHVESALLDAFSDRILPNGKAGFFHPDNLTFGQGLYVSRIVAAAQAVPGVVSARVTRLARYDVRAVASGPKVKNLTPDGGVLKLGPLEIAQLGSDPSFPENGRLTLRLRGGR